MITETLNVILWVYIPKKCRIFLAFCFMIKLTPRRAAAAAAEPKHPVHCRRPNVIGVGVYSLVPNVHVRFFHMHNKG